MVFVDDLLEHRASGKAAGLASTFGTFNVCERKALGPRRYRRAS
jgi:hypothetical protein